MARILVVDDDTLTRVMIEKVLVTGGHQVETAPEGRAALRQHQARPADLILLDIYMPGMEGLETIRAIRKEDDRVKIIAMTAKMEMGNPLGVATRLGANRALAKPFLPHELMAAIEGVLEG